MILFDSRDSGGWAWRNSLPPEAKLRATDHFFQTLRNPCSQSVSLSLERLYFATIIIITLS